MKFLMLELVLRLETSVAASKPVTHKLGVPFFLNKGPAVLLIFQRHETSSDCYSATS